MSPLPYPYRWLIDVASRLAPPGAREDWRREWEGEVGFAIRSGRSGPGMLFRTCTCFIDAVWLWRREGMMNGWNGDLRAAVRTLARSPGLTAVMVVTLGLGIGVNAALFSVVNGVVLRQLPLPEPEGLVYFSQEMPERSIQDWQYSYAQFRELGQRLRSVDLAVFSTTAFNLATADRAVRVTATRTSDTFFPITGLQPVVGRVFNRAEEAAGARVAVLSHEFADQHLSGPTAALGRTLTLGGESYEVIGVMPPEVRLVQELDARSGAGDRPVDIYLPLEAFASLQGDLVSTLRMIGRLAPGTSLEQARAEAEGVLTEFLESRGSEGWITRAYDLRTRLVGSVRRPLWILLGASGLLLVMVCVNLSGLQLVRSVGRSGEWAARKALGASRLRITRQLLTEGLLLSGTGGLVGLVLAYGGVEVLQRGAGSTLPRVEELSVDAITILFSAGLAVGATILFGLLPAHAAASRPPAAALATSRQTLTARGRRLLRGLVAAEVTMAIVLLAGSGVLLRSLGNLLDRDPGYSLSGVLRAQTELDDDRYSFDVEIAQFSASALDRLRGLPGVEKAAVAAMPNPTVGPRKLFQIDGLEGEEYRSAATENAVSPDYFDVMGIEVIEGRGFTEQDVAGSTPVVIMTRALAERAWPGESAIGKRISTGSWRRFIRTGVSTDPVLREVVGVVEDLQGVGIEPGPPLLAVFSPMAQEPWLGQVFLLRTAASDDQVGPVRTALAELDPNQPLYDIGPALEDRRVAIATERVSAHVLGGFALAALLLSILGVYGVVAYSVVLRRKEIGIRMAVGASSAALSRMFVQEGLAPVLLGMAAGIGIAFWAVGLLGSMLYDVQARDPLAFLAAGGVLALAAMASTYLPARRTARVDPVASLKGE